MELVVTLGLLLEGDGRYRSTQEEGTWPSILPSAVAQFNDSALHTNAMLVVLPLTWLSKMLFKYTLTKSL